MAAGRVICPGTALPVAAGRAVWSQTSVVYQAKVVESGYGVRLRAQCTRWRRSCVVKVQRRCLDKQTRHAVWICAGLSMGAAESSESEGAAGPGVATGLLRLKQQKSKGEISEEQYNAGMQAHARAPLPRRVASLPRLIAPLVGSVRSRVMVSVACVPGSCVCACLCVCVAL